MFADYDSDERFITVKTGQCGCGCGEAVNEDRTYLPGHDAKLKGKLQRAALAGVEFKVNNTIYDPLDYATSLGWDREVGIALRRKVAAMTALKDRAEGRAQKVATVDGCLIAVYVKDDAGTVRVEAVSVLGRPKRVSLTGDDGRAVMKAAGLD